MSMFPTDNPLKLRLELSRVEAAIATSQADVTRLTSELAESVRALAVSQGEVERLKVSNEILVSAARHWRKQTEAARGDLERARELLGDAANVFELASCDGTVLAADTANQLALRAKRIRAFLAPTASPEPDRASPEVTVKENDR